MRRCTCRAGKLRRRKGTSSPTRAQRWWEGKAGSCPMKRCQGRGCTYPQRSSNKMAHHLSCRCLPRSLNTRARPRH